MTGRRLIGALILLATIAACDGAPNVIPRWVPPVPGPMPVAINERMPLPFCGVATTQRDAVLRCMVEALKARRPAEVGIVTGPADGRMIGMVRLLPDMTVELLFFNDDRWQRATCASLVEDQPPEIINVDDCADPVDLVATG